MKDNPYDISIDTILRVAAGHGIVLEGGRPFTITGAVERLITATQHSIANRLQVKLLEQERKECKPCDSRSQ